MARPRKRLVTRTAVPTPEGSREQYLAGLRAERKLYDAEAAAALLGVAQDRLYALDIPHFEVSPRRTRWPGTAIADFLERGMAGAGSRSAYLSVLAGGPPLTATAVAGILGLHSDVVPFLGLQAEEWTDRGRTVYHGGRLAEWLDARGARD